MSSRTGVPSRFPFFPLCLLLVATTVIATASHAWAGGSSFRNSAVGGIAISADGIVEMATATARSVYLREIRNELIAPTGELAAPADLRMVSLRALMEAAEDAHKNNFGQLPDEVKYLGGLQRIQYVFVYPEKKDIVLAGPGEGWKLDDNGDVVGQKSGRPVLHFDDFLVALRSADAAQHGEITCSIDPTPEGWTRFAALMKDRRTKGANRATLVAAAKQAFGPQIVTINGVPATSRFARMMLSADFHMKLLAMEIQGRPAPDFPSYLDFIRNARQATNASPRWWLACNYQPMATSEDRLAWELRGPGVKALTEDDKRAADGSVTRTGRKSPAAEKWANLLTNKYDDLCNHVAVFGEMRNLMDMCVVAALIQKEGLWEKAGLDATALMNPTSDLKSEVWNAPKTVAPCISLKQVPGSLIVTASGGVQIDSWQVAGNVEVTPHVSDAREKACPNGTSLWWQ